jgi:hypothetical protein
MNIKDRVNVVMVIAIALFFYLSSELFLRETIVAKIDRKTHNVNALISDLPPGIGEVVRKKVHRMALNNALKIAGSSDEKLRALIELAYFVANTEEEQKFYTIIIKDYKSSPRALPAYLYFLENKSKKDRISIRDYQAFIKLLPIGQRFSAWSSGYTKLQQRGIDNEGKLEFLTPLLELKPKFWDYRRLYLIIGELAQKMKRNDVVKQAELKAKFCLDLPTIDDYMLKIETEKLNKKKKIKKSEKQKEMK